MLALQPFNLDFKNQKINIRRVVIFDGNKPKIKPIPKSDRGIRSVPMPDKVNEFLKEYCKSAGSYLFSCSTNELMTKSAYDKMWLSIAGQINKQMGGTPMHSLTDGLTAHTFRHNYCTELRYQIPTISTKKIAVMLGDSEKMALDVYSHIVEEKENVSEAIKKAINF